MTLNRILIGAGAIVAATLLVFAGWYYRPWAEYSPAKVVKGREAEDRVPFYRAMNDYFPYRDIPGSPNVVTLPRNYQDITIAYEHNGQPRTLDDYARDHDITGMMIVKDGEVVLENYWRGETPESLHTSWSVAKSFVSTLVGIAMKEGKIDSLDDKVVKYADIYQGTDYGDVTVGQLLMMSTGIDFNENYEEEGADIRRLFFNTFIMHRDLDKFVRQFEQSRPAGQDFEYLSSNTAVLGAVVSGAYDGENLATLASEKIFAPTGMKNGSWNLDRDAESGKELAYCCINIRLEDYAKFGLLYLNDGKANGQQVLPEGWPEFVSTPPQKSHQKGSADDRGYGYGQHFWIPPAPEGAYFAAGYNGQYVWIYPPENIVIAITGADRNLPEGNTEYLTMVTAALAAAAAFQTQ